MNCPVCSAAENTSTDHELYLQCKNCQSVFQYRDIKPVSDYYKEINQIPNNKNQTGSYRTYISIIVDNIKINPDYCLVDIGAGDGTFLELARKVLHVGEAIAIENSTVAIDLLKKKGLSIACIEDLSSVHKKIVVSFQVLEHINDPHVFLRSMYLQQGDYVVLTSPAVDSKYYRWYGKYWKSFSPSHHLVLHSRRGIEYIFKKANIKILYYGLCISASNSRLDSAIKFLKNFCIWPIRIILKGYIPPPRFYGYNSFLVIGRKQ